MTCTDPDPERKRPRGARGCGPAAGNARGQRRGPGAERGRARGGEGRPLGSRSAAGHGGLRPVTPGRPRPTCVSSASPRGRPRVPERAGLGQRERASGARVRNGPSGGGAASWRLAGTGRAVGSAVHPRGHGRPVLRGPLGQGDAGCEVLMGPGAGSDTAGPAEDAGQLPARVRPRPCRASSCSVGAAPGRSQALPDPVPQFPSCA